MSHIKTYKVLVDSVAVFDTDNLDVSNVIVQIKQKNGKILKNVPINLISKSTFVIETNQEITLLFSLLQNHSLGSRQPRPFADGVISVNPYQFQREQTIALACTIKNIITKKNLVNFAVVFKQDLQKQNCQIPDSEGSQSQQQKQQSPRIHIEESEPEPKKISPIKHIVKRPIRARHFQYSVKNEASNHQLSNIVTNESTNYVQNLRIDIDDAISSIEFYSRNRRQSLAEVLFKTNPSEQQLKKLKIKVPENQKIIDIHLNTIEGNKLISSTTLPDLDQKQCRAIECSFKDQHNQIKGKMKFNYKQVPLQSETKLQKMEMAKQIQIFQRKKIKQQLNFMPFLFPQPKIKPSESPRFKLPKIQKQPNFVSQTINEKIIPSQIETSSPRGKNLSNTHNISSNYNMLVPQLSKNNKQFDFDYKSKQDPINRPARSRTIQHRDLKTEPNYKQYINTQTIRNEKNIVKIVGVSIKFYKSYLQKRQVAMEIEPFVGKTLNIFSNPKHIFRSEAAYASKILNWNLRNCEIEMNQFDNVTFELNLYKEKTIIGQLIVSYNQLKFNQQQNSLYFGYLTNNHEVIAKICVDFRLQEGELNKYDYRQSALERTERRPRMRRLYSEDSSLNEDLYKREINSPNKGSLYQSLVIPQIPEVSGFKQTQMIKDKKKKRVLSPKKKITYN